MGTLVPVLDRVHQIAARMFLETATDRELLARFVADRDQNAFAAIVERHGPMILNLCRRIIGDTHLAEDAFQATLLVFARKAHSLKNPDAIGNWLYGAARKVALRAHQNRRRSRQAPRTELPAPVDPLAEISGRELIQLIETEIFRLPETYRTPLVLCTLEGFTINDVARQTRSTPASVRNRLARGRSQLAARLGRRGLSLPAALAALFAIPRLSLSAALRQASFAAVSEAVPASATIQALALGTTAFVTKMKLACAAMLVAGIVGFGYALIPAQIEPASPMPAPPIKTESEAQFVAFKTGEDQYGDPLPEGAIARFGTVRFRNVSAGPIVFSPDGRYVATSPDGVVLRDVLTGKVVRTLPSDGRAGISFSPDSKRLLVQNRGKSESIWDLESGKKAQQIGPGGGVFVQDGKRVIQVDWQGFDVSEIRLLDSATGKQIAKTKFNQPAHLWTASPAGDLVALAVAVSDNSQRIALVDVVTGNELELGDFAKSVGKVCGFVFSSDGRLLIIAGGKGVAVWDVATRKEIRLWRQRSDSPPVISADGKRIAWTGYDNQLGIAYVWAVDVKGGKPWHVGAPTNEFDAPAFSPDGKFLAVLDDGHALQFRDVATGKEIRPLAAHSGLVGGSMFTADGKHLITRDRNRVLVWDKVTTRLLRRYPDDLPEGERLFNSNAKTQGGLITVDSADVLRVRNLVTGETDLQLAGKHGFVGGAAGPAHASVDGKSAAIVGKDGDIRVYDLTTGQVRFQFDPEAPVWDADLSANGRYLQVSCQGRVKGELFVVDTSTGKEVDPKTIAAPPPKRLVEASEGRMFPVGMDALDWLQRQNLLDVTGKPLKVDWNMVGGKIYAPPNGRYIAVHHATGRRGEINDDEANTKIFIQIWDAETKKPLAHFNPQPILGEFALFSPNGRMLAVAGTHVISVWEVATGRERMHLRGHFGWITSLCFTPDGRGVVSGGDDTQVLLWDFTKRSPDGVWKTIQLSPQRLRELWKTLAGEDAAVAHRAIWELAADPDGTVKFIADELAPAKMPEASQVAKLIEQLSADRFTDREKAAHELLISGELVLPTIVKALNNAKDEEQRDRLQRILQELERTELRGSRLRQVRAIEVLEYIGTQESRNLLELLSRGDSKATSTKEAKFALGRY